MASGRFDLNGDNCCGGYVEWESTWQSGSSHTFTFNFFGQRKDWSGGTVFWYTVNNDDVQVTSAYMTIYGSNLLVAGSTTVKSDDYGKLASNLYFGCGFTSASTGNSFQAEIETNTIDVQLDKPPRTITIEALAGTSVVVQNADGEELSSGNTLYAGDTFTISTGTVIGYTPTTVTVTGATADSDGTYTATGNVSITASASVQSYALTIACDPGATVSVRRTSSPKAGASIGAVAAGEPVYYADVITVYVEAKTGYEVKSQTINGAVITNGRAHTVWEDVSIVISVMAMGLVYIDTGETFEKYLIYIDSGTGWDMYIPYIDNGTGWDLYS